MATPIVIHVRGQNRDGAGDPVDVLDVYVLMQGLLPVRPALHEAAERWGRRLYRRKGYRQKFTGQAIATTVTASEWDYGDYRMLEEILVNREEKYLVAEGTTFFRTNTTGGVDHNFWTGTNGLLTAAPLHVECTAGPDISPDFETGTDRCTFTLECVEPNT